MFTETAIAIEFLKNDIKSLEIELTQLDKTSDDYESKKNKIRYNIREDKKQIKQLESSI